MPGPPSDTPPKPPPSAPSHRVGKVLIQVSPWRDPTHGVLLTFTPQGYDRSCIRVLATSANPLLQGSRYALGTEYWYAAGDFPRDTPLVMQYDHGPWTVDEVDRRVDGLPLAFSAAQDAKGLWRSTRNALLEGATTHRFTAPDPESTLGEKLGLELSFTPTEGLVRAIWYKSNEPATGYVWRDLQEIKGGLLWSPAPSLETLAWSFAQGQRLP